MSKKLAKQENPNQKEELKSKEIPHSPIEEAARKEVPKDEYSQMSQLPKEAQEKLDQLKKTIEKFKSKLIEKFDKYVMGIAIMPPPKPLPGAPPLTQDEAKKIQVLILVDDSDSKRMPKAELGGKLQNIMVGMGKEIDPNLAPNVLLLSELWQNCYDGKTDVLQAIAMSAPMYDKGMLAAIKIAEVHKTMVLKKFERYIVSYVLAGSLVQGRATEKSDIDVFIVIDDTDVKRMTRIELKDKLRAIIIGMGIEAGEITQVRNKINIQVYILTEFWDSIREANPIIFTFLRDGVPLYDRGIFMPWKQLLRIGKIKPSVEAIELYMSTGDQMLKRVKYKLKEIGMEDTFWAILTPSQAALMLYGIPPPTPKETPEVMRDIFVKKEKILEDEFVQILETNIKLRKDLEHGDKKELSGKDVDKLLEDSERYLKRIDKLFTEIESTKQKENMEQVFDNLDGIVRDMLRLEGIEKVHETTLLKVFEDELVKSGKVSVSTFKNLKAVIKGREGHKSLTKAELGKLKKDAEAVMRELLEFVQRKRGIELNRAKVRVKYGDKYGEVIFLGDIAYLVKDLDVEREILKAKVTPKGEFIQIQKADLEEMERVLSSSVIPPKIFLKETLFENLKQVFGPDVEILVNY
ncbi:MAG: nucleotidyltransferase domain-containing protein [Nanoarchaeota archaeon]|nr:MAG: nucleotidyltransferase domain-containing protein [Nanoarchaeota archaeon]